ncbi:FecR family protein [Pedobacter sp. GR22-6]|uniref:FecR family protein n=1 Tax=Pedobacter sp. GR22-6 TaxID=3127957 RepID=UPI00307E6240
MEDKDIEQLLHQESFLNYCFKRNEDDVRHWESWLTQNPDQKQQFEDLKRMLLLMGEESRNRIMRGNFAQLQEKITSPSPVVPLQKYSFLTRWSVAAAAVFLIVGLSWFAYHSSEMTTTTAKVEDVAPGGNKATLILANGQRLNLGNVANGAIANQSGIRIMKTAGGQIIYQVLPQEGKAASAQFNTIETPVGGQYQVGLVDGTRVWLNAGSSLRYPLKFSKNERRVELTGEGYFEVAHDKSAPFKVSNFRQVVVVLGTHFNVMAYADEKVLKTTLLEGSVSIRQSGTETLLKPGQQAQLVNGKIEVVDDIDLEDVIAWKNGYFRFNESLESIMAKISRWYGVQIVYQTNIDASLTYSGKISRSKNISVILKSIEFDSDLHFRIEGKKVYVTK